MKPTLIQTLIKAVDTVRLAVRHTCGRLYDFLTMDIYIGRDINYIPGGSITFFPLQDNTFCCGIAAIVSYKSKKSTPPRSDTAELENKFAQIAQSGYETCKKVNHKEIDDHYLGGESHLESLWQAVQNLKCIDQFYIILPENAKYLSSRFAECGFDCSI